MKTLRRTLATAALSAGLLFGAASGAAPSAAATPSCTSVCQFWQLLYSLQSEQGLVGLVIAGPNPPTEHVIYGGPPLQAFLYAIDLGPSVQFVQVPVYG